MGNKPSGELDESDESIKKDFALHQKQAKQLNPQSQNQSQRKESTTQQQDENKPTQNDQPRQELPQPAPPDSQPEPEGAQPQEIPQPGSLVTSTNPLHASNRKVGLDDFDLMSVIGKGSFGKVFSVRKKDTGKVYAMKAERRILENIDHPFIVSLRFAFQTPEKLYFVLDLFTGGELFFHLKTYGRFTEQMVVFYAAELVLALDCLHSHNVIYRDLKPENILLDDDGHIRLTDFGLSKEMHDDGEIMTICGTPEYLSPEVISHQGEPAALKYTKAVDYWALGTLLYEMLVGIPPFYNNNVMQMYQRILSAPLQIPAQIMSPEAEDFIRQLLNRSPTARLGSNDNALETIKEHPWFKLFGLDFDFLVQKRIVPPFRPSSDQLNIDDEFQQELVADTPCQPNVVKGRVKFPQFSYQSPDDGLTGGEQF